MLLPGALNTFVECSMSYINLEDRIIQRYAETPKGKNLQEEKLI